jgi:hypothetical protein
MQPTLRDGDLLLVRWGAPPRAGRVAVVRLPPDDRGRPRPTSVKRLVRREADGWWVERDSPVEGVDSWQVGALATGDVLALVVARLWPRPARALPDPRE